MYPRQRINAAYGATFGTKTDRGTVNVDLIMCSYNIGKN